MNTLPHMVTPLVIWLFCSSSIVRCTADIPEVYHICSGRQYPLLDVCVGSIACVLNDLFDYTPICGYVYYTQCWDCYGHGVCNGAVTQSDCNVCFKQAAFHLVKERDRSRGAQVQLIDCRMRFEDYKFDE